MLALSPGRGQRRGRHSPLSAHMAVLPCRKCGALTSSAAIECPHCGSRQESTLPASLPPFFAHVRKGLLMASLLLAITSTVSWGGAYLDRARSEEHARLRAAEAVEAQKRERYRVQMAAKADSLQAAMPRRRHRTANSQQLREALGVVAVYGTDSIAQRWISSARAELIRRDRAAAAVEARRVRARSKRPPPVQAAAGPAEVQPYPVSAPVRSSGSVQVRGYYRKDGTYVRPHSRRRPRN